jgi:hypothetical protein
VSIPIFIISGKCNILRDLILDAVQHRVFIGLSSLPRLCILAGLVGFIAAKSVAYRYDYISWNNWHCKDGKI